MPKFTLLEMDMWPGIESRVKPEVIGLKKLPLKVVIECEKDLWKVIEKDPLLHQKMVDAVNKERATTTKKLVTLLSQHDALAATAPDAGHAKAQVKQFKAVANKEIALLESRGGPGILKVWDKFKKDKKQYRNYKLKVGFTIVADVAAIGVSVGTAVGTGGAALAVSIIGIIRATAGLAQKIAKAAVKAELLQKKIIRDLKTLKAAYEKASSREVGTEEALASYVNKVFNVDLLPTISTSKGDVGEYKNKLQGIDVGAHKTASSLNKTLGQLDKLMATVKDKKHDIDDKRRKKLVASVEKLETAVNNMIEKIIVLQERVEKGQAAHALYVDALDALGQKKPKWAKRVETAFIAIDIGFAAADMAGLANNAVNVFAKEVAIKKAGDQLLPN